MISVVINTLNEEKNLPHALASVKGFADEIVVVDMYSDDDTVVIAKSAEAKVFEHKRVGFVEPARNFAIEKATGDWILILDADEEIPHPLISILKNISDDPKSADYYVLPRKNIIFGKWIKHSRWWPDYNIRFFKKGHVSWSEIIHSVPVTNGKGADLTAIEENAILHNNYTSVDQYIERLNRYTTYKAPILIKGGYKFSWMDLIKEPVSEFVGRYFQGGGYKDGVHGLALALLQAFSELVLYLKIWQEEKFWERSIAIPNVVKEIKSAQKEINYWVANTQLGEGGSLISRVKRRLKIL
jgi:(heptosyl)LPS beta-1,4-glucosyltransferase